VPPICRKNVAEDVAMPIALGGTEDCMVSISGCMQLPTPYPTKSIMTPTTPRWVSAEIVVSANMPSAISAEPKIGKIRVRPVREMMRPDVIEAVIRPATIGSMRKPDSVGVAPCTICM